MTGPVDGDRSGCCRTIDPETGQVVDLLGNVDPRFGDEPAEDVGDDH